MKKIATLFAAAFVGVSAFAQQALWGGPQVESPVLNADGTVTFRYLAPKTVRENISGDIQTTRKIKNHK